MSSKYKTCSNKKCMRFARPDSEFCTNHDHWNFLMDAFVIMGIFAMGAGLLFFAHAMGW